MRKSSVLLALVVAATVPSAALAAAKNGKPAKPVVVSTTPANQNALSARVVVDGLHQIFVPFEVMLASK